MEELAPEVAPEVVAEEPVITEEPAVIEEVTPEPEPEVVVEAEPEPEVVATPKSKKSSVSEDAAATEEVVEVEQTPAFTPIVTKQDGGIVIARSNQNQ